MKRFFCLIIALVIVCSLNYNIIINAESQETTIKDPVQTLSISNYETFAEDGYTHHVKNFITGNELTYDADTNPEVIKEIYVEGLESDSVCFENYVTELNLDEIIEECGSETINMFTTDVLNAQNKASAPYSAICLIQVTYTNNNVEVSPNHATGFIIGGNAIATAAHIFNAPLDENYNEIASESVASVNVFAAYSGVGDELLFRKYRVTRSEYNNRFFT